MEPIKPTVGSAPPPATEQRCPLCGKSVTPEMGGLTYYWKRWESSTSGAGTPGLCGAQEVW